MGEPPEPTEELRPGEVVVDLAPAVLKHLAAYLGAEIRMWNGRLHDPEWLDVAEAYLSGRS